MTRYVLLVSWLVLLMFVLPAAADAPPSRYTFPVPGTVHDTRTNLTWQQAVDVGSYTQSAAASYCMGLTLANGEWRLPTRAELLTLVDPTKYDPAIDATAFPSAPSAYFWSSSAYAGPSGGAWFVHFDNGNSSYFVTSNTNRVRCVR